ncbi:hypothetical protein GYMLUDRAFT_41509 [Collybiopsis luxurians FD-317 M1]|uniref:CCAAT-binding factor domain-containing protein n=1 Tax=Collybiopsis luxurians FD-317 M1 TaxID=944289 RepID=A0A0D0CK03_9AGAR|nr:hypothetical protein GYMLUDRAFT_41509 [Collybiopsis luxurians FD-317 M1]
MPRSLPPPTKKRKVDSQSSANSFSDLEHQLTEAVSNNSSLNPLADLIDLVSKTPTGHAKSKGVYSLYRVFVIIISSGKMTLAEDDAAKLVKAWLWERFNHFVQLLCDLLRDEEKSFKSSALDILFSLQKHLSKAVSEASSQPEFHVSHFRKIVQALLGLKSDGKDVLDLFHEKWFSVYDDVRWFFLREAGSILGKVDMKKQQEVPENLLSILERLTTFPTEAAELNAWWAEEMGKKPKKSKGKGKEGEDDDDEEEEEEDEKNEDDNDWRKFFDEPSDPKDKSKNKNQGPVGRAHTLTLHQSLHNLSSHRAVFTRAWLNLLPKLTIPGNIDATKTIVTRALNVMHRSVLPFLTRPVLIMDWVGECIDYGGTVGLLALNALYVLMKEYNLDYPSFYPRLYTFLDKDVLHLKHRARFFRMSELFLSSTHLPLTLLASFIKRLARLSLSAPPSAIVMVIPFTYNIIKRHPGLMLMIHRESVDSEIFKDPFLPAEPNPLLTNALSSSLWELQSHRSHYHTPVSTLAKVFSEVFSKEYAMEDFLDHGYSSLFDAEANRKIKKEPALAMEIEMGSQPSTQTQKNKRKLALFGGVRENGESGDEDAVGLAADVVNDLWVFG